MATPGEQRQRRAIAAAQAVVARHGIEPGLPRMLQDSNHTVIHLAPAPIVAKVNTSPEDANLEGGVATASRMPPICCFRPAGRAGSTSSRPAWGHRNGT